MEINATLLVQLVIFLLLLTWLSRFLFAPLLKLFDEREKRIDGAKKEAEQMQLEAHQRLSDIEDKIRAAQADARLVLTELKAQGAEYQRSVVEAARKEAKEQLDLAREKLALDVAKVRETLAKETDSLADLTREKVLGDATAPSGSKGSGQSKLEFSNA